MSEITSKIGFVFINSAGQYAFEHNASGFAANTMVVTWLNDINEATVFPHENIARRKHKSLTKCHAIPAKGTRMVVFRDFEKPPVAPVGPPACPPLPGEVPFDTGTL